MFSNFFINRPIFASVLSIIITLAGGVALFTLPIAQYPVITPPTIEVSANYPGANAQVVADTVAAPIEHETIDGVAQTVPIGYGDVAPAIRLQDARHLGESRTIDAGHLHERGLADAFVMLETGEHGELLRRKFARAGFERRRERDARYCQAADLWEAKLALLKEFLPEAGPAPARVWSRIEQKIARERVGFSRPLVWQVTSVVLALVVVALLFAVAR